MASGPNWTRPEDLVGETLEGRFKLLRLMGVGGMGAVYEARHLRIDKRVAVKVLSPALASDERHAKRFLREARAANRIRSEHVVEMIDFGEDPTAFFVMEFLEGRDLAQLLRETGPLPWARARTIADQIVVALYAAHVEGIVHRDMKPANIFIRQDKDGNDFAKVLDFGIAKVAESSADTRGITRTDEVMGTVNYMAPEQATGGPVDLRTDIYAVGIIIFEMLSGKVPFDGKTSFHVMQQHVRETPPRLRLAVPTAPYEVEQLVLQCMAKDPKGRFQSMERLADAIRKSPDAPRPVVAAPAQHATPAPPTVLPGPSMHAEAQPTPGDVVSTLKLDDAELARAQGRLPGTEILSPVDGSGPAEPRVEPTVHLDGPSAPPPPIEVAPAVPPPELAPLQPGTVGEFASPGAGPVPSPVMVAAGPSPAPKLERSIPGRRDDFTITSHAKRSTSKVVLLLAVGLVVAIGGGVGVATWLSAQDDDEAAIARPAAPRTRDRPRAPEPAPETVVEEGLQIAAQAEVPATQEPTQPSEVVDPPEPSSPEPEQREQRPEPRQDQAKPKPPAEKTKPSASATLTRLRRKARARCKSGAIGDKVVVSLLVRPDGGTSLVEASAPNERTAAGRCAVDLVKAAEFPPNDPGRRTLIVKF